MIDNWNITFYVNCLKFSFYSFLLSFYYRFMTQFYNHIILCPMHYNKRNNQFKLQKNSGFSQLCPFLCYILNSFDVNII